MHLLLKGSLKNKSALKGTPMVFFRAILHFYNFSGIKSQLSLNKQYIISHLTTHMKTTNLTMYV